MGHVAESFRGLAATVGSSRALEDDQVGAPHEISVVLAYPNGEKVQVRREKRTSGSTGGGGIVPCGPEFWDKPLIV